MLRDLSADPAQLMVLSVKPHHRKGHSPLALEFLDQLGLLSVRMDLDVGCIDMEPQGLLGVLLHQLSDPSLDLLVLPTEVQEVV